MGSSLTQDAYERLRADLLACRPRPGARLKINELCQVLSVSLSAVREALARLTSEELVTAGPQRGFRVAPISADELRDLTAVRAGRGAMPGARGRRGRRRLGVAARRRLRLSRTPGREPEDPERVGEAWSAGHADYHEALVAACDSPWLLRLRVIPYAQSERYRRLSVPPAEIARDLNREHQGLMEAALTRDAGRTRALMAEHIELTTRVLLEQSWPSGASPASIPDVAPADAIVRPIATAA